MAFQITITATNVRRDNSQGKGLGAGGWGLGAGDWGLGTGGWGLGSGDWEFPNP